MFYTKLSMVPNFDASPEDLVQPDIEDTQVRLQIEGSADQILGDISAGEPERISFIDLDEPLTHGPPHSTRYSPIVDTDGGVSAEFPGIDLLRPFLHFPFLSSEMDPSLAPFSLLEHQIKASKALFDRRALLLADDLATGKKAALCVALTNLFQQGEAARALVLYPDWAGNQWVGALQRWAPSIASIMIKGERECREVGWKNRVHVYMTDYQTFVQDIENELLTIGELVFDLLILDGISNSRYQTRQIMTTLKLIHAEKRWALAGSLPRDPEGWLNIFGLLTPERVGDVIGLPLPDIEKRFFPFMLRRSKADLMEALPRLTRHEVWLDLDPQQAQAYEEVLREERDRLSELGSTVTRTHVMAAIDRLKKLSNFTQDWLDGVKVRALVDLIEDISGSGMKVVVFSQYRGEGLDRLRPSLEAYGVLSLYEDTSESERSSILEAFRKDTQWHVLLMETGACTDGESLPEATYILHFDHYWNPTIRREYELRLVPSVKSGMPLDIYEFWVADTIDEKIYALLAEHGLLPHFVPDDTQPEDIEERLTLEDWLRDVLEVPSPPEPILGVTMPISPEVEPPSAEPLDEEILLPPTEVEDEEIIAAEDQLIYRAAGEILPLPTEIEGEGIIAADEQPPSVESVEEDLQPFPPEVEEEDISDAEVQPPSFESVEGEILLLSTEFEGEDILTAEDQPLEVEVVEEDAIPQPMEYKEEQVVTLEVQPSLDEPRERDLWTLPLEGLAGGIDLLMQDQGYPDLEVVEELHEGGGEWIAQRALDDELEYTYVRFFRTEKNIDIRKARAVLESLETHSGCQVAFIVTTRDFSRSCKKLAKDSEGKLVLITGEELSEYVQFEHDDVDDSFDDIW